MHKAKKIESFGDTYHLFLLNKKGEENFCLLDLQAEPKIKPAKLNKWNIE